MPKQPKKIISLSLPLDLYEQLKRYAEDDCRTVPSQIRQILKKHCKSASEKETPD